MYRSVLRNAKQLYVLRLCVGLFTTACYASDRSEAGIESDAETETGSASDLHEFPDISDPSADPCEGAVRFPDPNLEAAVRETLEKPTGDIFAADCQALYSLWANQTGISNLEGIQCMTNLMMLLLGANEIEDISPLSGLRNLRILSLTANHIRDLEPLSGLEHLNELYADHNEVIDASPLFGMPELMSIDLGNNKISDTVFLSGMNGLYGIDLNDNALTDISGMKDLPNLHYLNLQSNNLVDISPLAELTSLEYLHLAENDLADISPVEPLAALQGLDLRENKIRDIGPVARNEGIGFHNDSNMHEVEVDLSQNLLECEDSITQEYLSILEQRPHMDLVHDCSR